MEASPRPVVMVVGPESSGTRLLTGLVSDLGVEAVHRSVPYGPDWWPDRGDALVSHVVVIWRDLAATLESQQRNGHLRIWGRFADADERYSTSVGEIVRHVHWGTIPFLEVQYEALVDDPQFSMDGIADWLDVPRQPVTREVWKTRPTA